MRVRNRWPAWLDLARGMTGLALVLFLWAHLFAVSSILLGAQAMYRVTRFFEGTWMLDQPQPLLVSLVWALGLLVLTTDGDLIHRLTHPNRKLAKRYRIAYKGQLVEDAVARCREGILLQGDERPTRPAQLSLDGDGQATLTLREGVAIVPCVFDRGAITQTLLNLFENAQMFCDLYCLEPGQEQAVHEHAGATKFYYVLEGRVSVVPSWRYWSNCFRPAALHRA